MKKADFIIGIDPDSDKSGVAHYSTGNKVMVVHSLKFPQLVDYVVNESRAALLSGVTLDVVIEAGWLNESHWHLNPKDSKLMAAFKGNAVGRNHETGRKIVEMCKHYGIQPKEVKPLRKIWKGKDGKITHDEISVFIPGFPSKSNQEVRDAALIAWMYAGEPIKLNTHLKK